MTFEDIHNRIAAGIPAASLEEVEQELDILTGIGGNIPVKMALAIAEARNFRRADKTFWTDAKERWRFPGEKTIYHYYGVGMLLIALRDFKAEADSDKENRTLEAQSRKCYGVCLGLEFGKLDKLTVLFNDKKRGIVDVMNFLKNHNNPEWTNKEFIRKVDELYGYGRKDTQDQLTFKFDIFDDVGETAVEDLFARDIGADSAMQIATNSALWCRHATRKLADQADEFSDAALTEFERLSSELAEAKQYLDSVIAARRRGVLGLN